ncbi:hypothetical protein ACP4OV_011835 [Aristida adscensionis]
MDDVTLPMTVRLAATTTTTLITIHSSLASHSHTELKAPSCFHFVSSSNSLICRHLGLSCTASVCSAGAAHDYGSNLAREENQA